MLTDRFPGEFYMRSNFITIKLREMMAIHWGPDLFSFKYQSPSILSLLIITAKLLLYV